MASSIVINSRFDSFNYFFFGQERNVPQYNENRGEGGGLTANLQGPLVFNLARRLGRQLVLTSSRYAVRYPLSGQAAPTLLPVPSPLRATA